MAKAKLYWHFASVDRRLAHGDGREIRKGATHSVEGRLVACENAMHGATTPLVALAYGPGPIACLVKIPRARFKKDQPGVVYGRSRTVVEMVDATEVLRAFVIETLRAYQKPLAALFDQAGLGEHAAQIRALTFEDLNEARVVLTAAKEAAWNARAAFGDAAWVASRAAAGTAFITAWDAAWVAALNMISAKDAWNPAWEAVRDRLNTWLEDALRKAFQNATE